MLPAPCHANVSSQNWKRTNERTNRWPVVAIAELCQEAGIAARIDCLGGCGLTHTRWVLFGRERTRGSSVWIHGMDIGTFNCEIGVRCPVMLAKLASTRTWQPRKFELPVLARAPLSTLRFNFQSVVIFKGGDSAGGERVWLIYVCTAHSRKYPNVYHGAKFQGYARACCAGNFEISSASHNDTIVTIMLAKFEINLKTCVEVRMVVRIGSILVFFRII